MADLALLLGSVICYIYGTRTYFVCARVRLYKSGEGKKEPVQEANTVYISIMNQVPERARERV